jgi:hypothetical protein
VCHRHLAGPEPFRAAADEGGRRRRVMRRAEGTPARQAASGRMTGGLVDAGDLARHVAHCVLKADSRDTRLVKEHKKSKRRMTSRSRR